MNRVSSRVKNAVDSFNANGKIVDPSFSTKKEKGNYKIVLSKHDGEVVEAAQSGKERLLGRYGYSDFIVLYDDATKKEVARKAWNVGIIENVNGVITASHNSVFINCHDHDHDGECIVRTVNVPNLD